MKWVYRIGVTHAWGLERVVLVVAENANEAVVDGLVLLGIGSLVGVSGITIGRSAFVTAEE